MMKLHLGCGHQYLEGWVNIDGPKEELPYDDLIADCHAKIQDLNYPDNSVDEILMEAVFEHFPRHVAIMQLRKLYTWLKPGGKLTILVPDFWGTVKLLKKSKSVKERLFWYRHLFGPQDSVDYGTHYDAFDVEKLEHLFSIVGFKKTRHEKVRHWPNIRFTGIKTAPIKTDIDAQKDIIEYMAYCETASEKGLAFGAWMDAMGLKTQKPPTEDFKTHLSCMKKPFLEKLKTFLGKHE